MSPPVALSNGRPASAIEDKSAAVAVVFAVCIIPITMLAALIIDFGWVLQTKSKLDLAADAAALAAVRTAAAGYAGGQISSQYMGEATTAANQWWAAQSGSVPQATSITATPTIVQNGTSFTATVTYHAAVTQILAGVFNSGSAGAGCSGPGNCAQGNGGGAQGSASGNATIANSVSASIQVNAYGTVDFLLDNTSSMMLPATNADLAKLQQGEYVWLNSSRTNLLNVVANADGLAGWNGSNASYGVTASTALPIPTASLPVSGYCAFACHWSATSTAVNPTDYYGVARQSGETMRFDVVQSATITAIQAMESREQAVGQLSVGVFSFGGVNMTSPSYVNTIFPETPIDLVNAGVVTRNAGAIAAMAALSTITPPVSGDIPNTNVGTALADTLAITGPSGDGNTASSPKKSLILVTDGIEDDTNPQSIPRTEGPVNPTVCDAVKNAGYTVYVLYTPYNSAPVYLPNNMALQPYITGGASPSVLSALQSCASSPSDVIQATAPADIQAGMITLITQAVGSTTHFTN